MVPCDARAAIQRGASRRASIIAIAYHLGVLKPIADIDFLRDDPMKLSLYRSAGLEWFAESDLPMRDLAYRSASKTLDASSIRRSEIDVCLYVAESIDRDEPVSSSEVNRLLVQLGLAHVQPICISASNCTNIMSALRVATALVESNDARHVLIVSVDKASRRYGSRKMAQEISLKSDGSVSCLVSPAGVGDYNIMYLAQHNAAGLANVEITSASYAVPKFQSIRGASRQAKTILAASASEFSHILTHNYVRHLTESFVQLCGFPREVGWFDNIGRIAHSVAGDVLINLKDLEAHGAIKSGDLIFIMADSVSGTSILCLDSR